jgi:hypothetical protein
MDPAFFGSPHLFSPPAFHHAQEYIIPRFPPRRRDRRALPLLFPRLPISLRPQQTFLLLLHFRCCRQFKSLQAWISGHDAVLSFLLRLQGVFASLQVTQSLPSCWLPLIADHCTTGPFPLVFFPCLVSWGLPLASMPHRWANPSSQP